MQMGAGARFWVSILVFWVGMSGISLVRAGMLASVKIFDAELHSQGATSGTVEGRVVFQKRFTKVLHEECHVGPCLESQAYWSVLIQSQDSSFLVNQRFQVGNAQAPFEVELGGVVLREGMWVQLEGAIYAYSLNLFVISELQKVHLSNAP